MLLEEGKHVRSRKVLWPLGSSPVTGETGLHLKAQPYTWVKRSQMATQCSAELRAVTPLKPRAPA